MRALVTGATGYIGSHLCAHLIARRWDVHAVVRPESDLARVGGLPGVTRHLLARAGPDLDEIFRAAAPDVVLNLAASVFAGDDRVSMDRLIDDNVRFAAQLARALTQAQAALVHAATWWEWDAAGGFAPTVPYAATKAAGRIVLESAARATPFAMTSLIIHDVYGPGDWRGKVVDAMIRAAIGGHELTLSPGLQRIDLVHVADVAAAFEQAVHLLRQGGKSTVPAYHTVTTGRTLSLRELAACVERATGRPLKARWGARPYARNAPMAPGKMAQQLSGWTPRIGLDEGVRSILKEMAL